VRAQSFVGTRASLPKPTQADCYAFPHHQVYLDGGVFLQTRSGPNWEGGVITLATCKHHLRTTRTPEEWIGVWFAGFTPKINGENYLLYLAEVTQAFDSNYALGQLLKDKYPRAYAVKNAANNPLGDVYPPSGSLRGEQVYYRQNFSASAEHVRQELKHGEPKWYSDIEYIGRSGRRPAALVLRGSVFKRPTYRARRPLHRSGWRCSLSELINAHIEEVVW